MSKQDKKEELYLHKLSEIKFPRYAPSGGQIKKKTKMAVREYVELEWKIEEQKTKAKKLRAERRYNEAKLCDYQMRSYRYKQNKLHPVLAKQQMSGFTSRQIGKVKNVVYKRFKDAFKRGETQAFVAAWEMNRAYDNPSIQKQLETKMKRIKRFRRVPNELRKRYERGDL